MQVKSQIFDVDSTNFEQEVLAGSSERVIVVDFWAPWCGPCKTLGPMLEEVVTSLGAGIALAKVNVDENQDLATAFRVQGIPAVKIVKDGQLVDEFTGALPKAQVEEMLKMHVPDAPPTEAEEADDLASQARVLLEMGDLARAGEAYRQLLGADEANGAALVGLARISLLEGRFDDVAELAGKIEQGTAEYDQGQALLTHLELHRQCAEAGGRQACETKLESDGEDTDAHFNLGCCAAVEGDYETALREWFEIVERNSSYREGAAKDAMVSVFHLLGRNHPVVGDYPQRLYRTLY
jgi:putative thioredoxin